MVRTSAKVVLVTCSSLAEARRIAKTIVTKRVAACVNVLKSPVESVYRWKGRVENAREFLLVIKTTKRRLNELEKELELMHSYEVPEFLILDVAGGSEKYLEWLAGSV
jgi:periplasmic divalent cation tolerance protein